MIDFQNHGRMGAIPFAISIYKFTWGFQKKVNKHSF